MGIESTEMDSESSLDASRERIVYEVGGSPRAYLESLERALLDAGLEHHFDINGDLVVYADDEEAAEQLFDNLPDAEVADDTDGLAAVVQMTAMWHSVGTLESDPRSVDGVLGAAKAADALERLPLPFGFEPPEWKRIVGMSTRLRDQLESTDDDAWDDDQVIDAAGELRGKLTRYV